MRKTTYNVDEIKFIINSHTVRDYGEGDTITVARNNDLRTLHVGATGEYIFSQSNDKSATITLNLLQNSADLAILEDLAEMETPFSATLVDMNTGKTYSSIDTVVSSLGEYKRGAEAQDVSVTLLAGRWE